MKNVILFLTGLCFSMVMQAQTSKTLAINAGELYAALTVTEKNTITHLTLTGTADARDFKTMRDYMPVLAEINMSEITILTYTGPGGTLDDENAVYPANKIPDFAFCNQTTYKGKTSLTNFTIPLSVVTIGSYAFYFCSSLTSITFPVTLAEINPYAFAYCTNLSSLILPSSLRYIHQSAFKLCTSLTTVQLQSGITDIENSVFSYCVKLTSFTVPNSVTTIGERAFENCTVLSSVSIPASVLAIQDYAFSNCPELTSFTLPSSLLTIGICAFQSCTGLRSIQIPASVNSIGAGVFRGADISVTIDPGNSSFSVSNGVLYDKNQKNIYYCPTSKRGSFIIPATVTSIVGSAFYQCTDLTSIDIPGKVTYIGSEAFYSCNSLTSIRIPSGITTIGTSAFYNCNKIKTIYAYPRVPVDLNAQINVFYGISKTTAILYVPFGVKSAYQAAYQWKDFININEMPGFMLSSFYVVLQAAQGSTASVTLSSNVSWTAVSDQNWLSVSPASGNSTSTINLTATANPLNTPRKAKVTFTSSGIDSLYLNVSQETNILSTQQIQLKAGWNIISFNVLTVSSDLKDIFQPLINSGYLIKVQDEIGKSLENLGIFGGWTNNIGNMSLTEGYKVKTTALCTFSVSGFSTEPVDIPLKQGWNIMGYPRNSAEDGMSVVQQLINRGTLVKVQDEVGKSIENLGIFGGWTNNIGNFMPGEGYKIKVNTADTLFKPN